MGRIFLQFGEAANSSLVHLWNYLSFGEESDADSSVRTKLFGTGTKPNALIYSERIGLKGIISQGPIEGARNKRPRTTMIQNFDKSENWQMDRYELWEPNSLSLRQRASSI